MSEQCGKLNHIYAYEESEVVFGPYDGSWGGNSSFLDSLCTDQRALMGTE